MKKLTLLGSTMLVGMLAIGVAQAADIPPPVYKAPIPLPPPAFSWTGFYIGAHGGGGWSTKEWFAPDGFPEGSYNLNGFLAGGQIGYNLQSGWVVVGIEADGSWTNLKGTGICFTDERCTSKVTALGTITGRIGGTVDHALLYIKGGGAWAREKHTDVFDGFGTASSTRWGWIIGGGVEYAFTPNVSGKLEYNYMDFGTKLLHFTGSEDFNERIRQSVHAVKIGINYRFGGPVVAKY